MIVGREEYKLIWECIRALHVQTRISMWESVRGNFPEYVTLKINLKELVIRIGNITEARHAVKK